MDTNPSKKDRKNTKRSVFAEKNYFPLIEKILDNRNKQIFAVILIIGILLLTLSGGKDKSTKTEYNNEEQRLCEILGKIEGCGRVSIMVTYTHDGNKSRELNIAKGAIVVADGADNIIINNKISEAVQAALNLPAHKVKVYKSTGKD